MAYVERYRIELSNKRERYYIKILEDEYAGGVTSLACQHVELKYTNNDETKYPEIRGSQLTMRFVSQNNFNLEDLVTDNDFQFKVELYTLTTVSGTDNSALMWVGFLSTDDCSEALVDDPKEIVLVANDGLAYLKTVPFIRTDGDISYNYVRLLTAITYCIFRTNLLLNLHIEVSIFEESMNDRTDDPVNEPLNQTIIHTRSFLKDKTTYEDCYTVLQRILAGFTATLFQQHGVWYIMRYHDRWNANIDFGTVYVYPWDEDVSPASTSTDHRVLMPRDMFPVDVDHIKSFQSPIQYSKVQYNYKSPEFPRNALFEGDNIPGLSSATNDANTIDFWTYYEDFNLTTTSTGFSYRNVVYDADGRLVESYIVLARETPAAANLDFLAAESIDVSAGDKLTFSAEVKTKFVDTSPIAEGYQFLARLDGDSTTVYYLRDRDGDGDPSVAAEWVTPGPGSVTEEVQYNPAEWHSVSFFSDPIPESGTLNIALGRFDFEPNPNESWYKNVNIKLTPSTGINELKGEFSKLNKNGTRKTNSEKEISVSDSPKRIISGALLELDESTLTSSWYRQDISEDKRLIRLNDLARFQSAHRLMKKISGTFLQVSYEDPNDADLKVLIGPANTYVLGYGNLNGVVFMSTNISIDLINDKAKLELIEFYDSTKDGGDPTGDSSEFEYIYE